MNARHIISCLLERSGINAAVFAARRESLTVLCYHRVLGLSDPARAHVQPALVTSTHIFEQQMGILARHFSPVALGDVVRWFDGDCRMPRRAVLVTFDDGWSDTYYNAFPAMRRLAIPGVVFLTTGFIGTNRRQWADVVYQSIAPRSDSMTAEREIERLKSLPEKSREAEVCTVASLIGETLARGCPNMTWDQVEEMQQHGFEFGSHTRSHMILPREPDDAVREELVESGYDIHLRTARWPVAFAYPDGQFDGQCARMVGDTGYNCAFTTDEGLAARHSDRLALPRLSIHDGVSATSAGDFSRSMFLTYLAGTIPWRYRRGRR